MSITVKRVLLLDGVDPMAHQILKDNGIDSTLFKDKLTVDELVSKLKDYEGVVIRSATKMTADIISKCPQLKIIGRAGTGVDNIDIPSATKHGVLVMNTPGGNTLSAAEHTCTLIACMSRNLPNANASMKAGKWERKAFMGHELYGKTLAIIGLGRIGREVAHRMQSFGMTTIGFDPMVSKEDAAKDGIEWLELNDIWPRSDYITVHTPLIPQTKGLLNKESFGKCKKGVRVVNCARGGIIDEDHLLDALNEGQCGGAGLDVYVEEPATNMKLIEHPNVVAAPHLGASTKEAQSRCGREVAQQIADVCNLKSFFGVLNAPALTQVQNEDVKGKCQVARYLASLLSNFAKSAASLSIKVSENDMKKGKFGINASACAGLVSNTEQNVNIVNSPTLAEQRGFKVSMDSASNQDNCIAMELKGDNFCISATGADKNGLAMLDSLDGKKFSSPVLLSQKSVMFKSDNISGDIGKLFTANMQIASIHMTSDSSNNWVVAGVNGDMPSSLPANFVTYTPPSW